MSIKQTKPTPINPYASHDEQVQTQIANKKLGFPPVRVPVPKQVLVHVDENEWEEFCGIIFEEGYRYGSQGSPGKFLKAKMAEVLEEGKATK